MEGGEFARLSPRRRRSGEVLIAEVNLLGQVPPQRDPRSLRFASALVSGRPNLLFILENGFLGSMSILGRRRRLCESDNWARDFVFYASA